MSSESLQSAQSEDKDTYRILSMEHDTDNTITANIAFNASSFSRNLAEFDRLYQYFIKAFPQRIIPATPPQSSDLLMVANGLEKFLDRVNRHEVLRISQGFIDFTTSEFVVPLINLSS
jgi:PX domain